MKKETDHLIVELPSDKDDKQQLALPLDKDGLPEVGALKEEVLVAEPEPEPKAVVPEARKQNEDAIEALKAQIKRQDEELRLERSAREQAQTEAAQRRAEAEEATGRASVNEVEMVNGYIQAAKAKADAVRREIKSARSTGDHDRADDLQMEAATIAARLMQYEDAKRSLDDRAAAPKPEPKRQEAADPFEQRIATLSDPSKRWLREHRECITDQRSNAKLTAGHYSAVSEGLQPDSPQYFSYIEKHMGYAKDETDDGDEVEVEAPVPRRSSAAPVSRGSQRDPKTGYIGNGQYQLTPKEADMAEHLGMTPTEYNTWKQKAIKDGRYAND